MKFEDVKPGMVLFEKEKREYADFNPRVYRLVFKKDSRIRLFEISEGDAAREWFYAIRTVDKVMWDESWSDNKIKVIPKSKLLDLLFTEIEWISKE